MQKGYEYRPASIEELGRRWDRNIADNAGDARWREWKDLAIANNIAGKSRAFVVMDGDEPIGEGTLVYSPDFVEINALRIDAEFEGRGHISALLKVMEQYAAEQGYGRAKIGASAHETRNLSIYFHWGYTEFDKAEYSEIPEEGLVLYYYKNLLKK
ncbi:MAG: GNAT family N-acetyltransferase [Defluviitaleaceae bacterium]|nr:GNAT family N-acetyltransferase [Defluviitaleaceae bacterium]